MLDFLKKNINFIGFLILFSMIISLSAFSYAQYVSNSQNAVDKSLPFSYVPENSYAYEPIHRLRSMGVTQGIGSNRFGYGRTITRAEFIAMLVNLLDLDGEIPQQGSFSDNMDPKKFYFRPIETALKNGIITNETDSFRPGDPITRQDAVVMIINSLGYGKLAGRLHYFEPPYEDVSEYTGYITIAKDFGIISEASAFNPNNSLLREQAAAMLVRMLGVMERKINSLNAFYAISSSPQSDKIPDLTSVSFGWSSLGYDDSDGNIILNMSRTELGLNDFYLPTGFSSRLKAAKEAGVPTFLMVYADQSVKIKDPVTNEVHGLPEYIFNNDELTEKVIDDITNALESVTRGNETGSFDGVVIDFEGLRGESAKNGFNKFLKKLKDKLDLHEKKLFVAVHPLIHPRRSSSSIDGYDYRTIGELADKVILMAHDYDAKRLTRAEMERGVTITPLTPLEDVYFALHAISDSTNGVQDKNKIMLQISFDWTVWKKQNGKTLNQVPLRYNLENFLKLLDSDKDISYHYHEDYENPYLKYTDDSTGVEYTVWYENSRSVLAKIKLARHFGIDGISLWRLGLIPDRSDPEQNTPGMDVWQSLLAEISN